MNINIAPNSSTMNLTSFLKPYVSQSHLISSVLYFIQIFGIHEISIFSDEEVVNKILMLNNNKTNIYYKKIDCSFLALDISYLKNEFVNINYLKKWLKELNGKKILLYDLFKENSNIFELSDYILLQEERIPVRNFLDTNI